MCTCDCNSVKSQPISIIFALPKPKITYKTGHAFSYLLLKESVDNVVIIVSLFARPVCYEPRHRPVDESSVAACVDAEGRHFEHYL